MDKPVRIFRHTEDGGPGYLLEVMDRVGVPFEVIAVDRGHAVPRTMDDVSGLVFLGGSMAVQDDLPWISRECRLIREAARHAVPVLGHGFGAELVTHALGGMVVRSRVKRIGWFPVRRVDGAPTRPWLAELPETFEVFHWQEHAFSLPVGATSLLTSAWCIHEGYMAGTALALQGHLEITEAMVRQWIAGGTGRMSRPIQETAPPDNLTLNWGAVVQSGERICAHLARKVADAHRVADAVYSGWLRLITG